MLPARSKRKRNSTSTDSERKQYFFWLFRKGAYAHAEKKQHFSNGCRKEIVLLSVSERKQYFSWQFGQGACTHSEKKQYFFNGRGKEIVLLYVTERKQYFSHGKRKGNSTFAEKKQYIANGTLILSSFFRNLGVEKVPDGSSKISKTICSGLTLSIIGITR